MDGPAPTADELAKALADQTARALVHPVYFGSAHTGQGIQALLSGIVSLLPAAGDTGVLQGTVFAVERAASGAKTAYLRLAAGQLTVRQDIELRGADGRVHRGRITSLAVIGRPGDTTADAGCIAAIKGLPGIRVGDRLGEPAPGEGPPRLPVPTLHTVVHPVVPGPGPAHALHRALLALADSDPLIQARTEQDGTTSVLLYGEVQKEVIAATLLRDFGVQARFTPSRPRCTERPVGTGEGYLGMEGRTPSTRNSPPTP